LLAAAFSGNSTVIPFPLENKRRRFFEKFFRTLSVPQVEKINY
jgi:hypothetical protein